MPNPPGIHHQPNSVLWNFLHVAKLQRCLSRNWTENITAVQQKCCNEEEKTDHEDTIRPPVGCRAMSLTVDYLRSHVFHSSTERKRLLFLKYRLFAQTEICQLHMTLCVQQYTKAEHSRQRLHYYQHWQGTGVNCDFELSACESLFSCNPHKLIESQNRTTHWNTMHV